MRKRNAAAFARPPRKRLASDAEVLAALTEGLDRLPERTPEQVARGEKEHARFERWWEKGRAKWDALTPIKRQAAADRMLADIRRYDRDADDRDLGPDGGREMFGMLFACDRQQRRRDRDDAKRPAVDLYAAHRVTIAREVAAADALRPAPATEVPTATDELAERRKARTRRPAGLAGYIDPRLIDDDDDDWGWS